MDVLSGGHAEIAFAVVVVLIVLGVETSRRATPGAEDAREGNGLPNMTKLRRSLQWCAPEILGLVACLLLASLLRARGDTSNLDNDAWNQIKREWPLLITADSLLALQAMLRLVICISALLRTSGPGASFVPLCQEPATLFGFASMARVALLARGSPYTLDGPLGGALPAACELAVVPLFTVLGFQALRQNVSGSALAIAAAAWFASRNHLSIANDPITDSLFSLAHALELLGAFAYLARTVFMGCSGRSSLATPHVGFAHVILVAQQCMPAYYFSAGAFEYSPDLVGIGRPFELLQFGSIIQLGAFFAAFAFFIAEATGDDTFYEPTAAALSASAAPRTSQAASAASPPVTLTC